MEAGVPRVCSDLIWSTCFICCLRGPIVGRANRTGQRIRTASCATQLLMIDALLFRVSPLAHYYAFPGVGWRCCNRDVVFFIYVAGVDITKLRWRHQLVFKLYLGQCYDRSLRHVFRSLKYKVRTLQSLRLTRKLCVKFRVDIFYVHCRRHSVISVNVLLQQRLGKGLFAKLWLFPSCFSTDCWLHCNTLHKVWRASCG